LAQTYPQACISAHVNLGTGNSVDLMRLRTAANGPIIKVFLSTGRLYMRSDFSGTQRDTGVALGSGWHALELCGTVGLATAWDLYRDGVLINTWLTNTGTVPIGLIQIGDNSAKTFTINFDHVRLDRTRGEDAAGDVDPPTVPGTPTGQSTTPTTIDLTWTASTDASLPITYAIYRDGGTSPIGSTGSTSFTDSGLTSGSTHTYTVDASDNFGNTSAKSPVSAAITVMPSAGPIFADDFGSGNFSAWNSSTRLTIDATGGSPAPPSARAQVTNQSAFANRTLAQTYAQACMSVNVNLASGNSIDLFRLRTAANGQIIKVFVSSGRLYMRSDFAGVQRDSGVALGGGWHGVELCGTVGPSSTWNLYRDGTLINTWLINTGTVPIGLIQIGDNAAKTFTINFDRVRFDTTPGG
jgi:hypothetical protein